MFVEGVRKYADDPNVRGLGGFTLQGSGGLGHLDKVVSARIGWDPYEDHVPLMRNYISTHYGSLAAQQILNALRINSLALADYFSDYAGSLSLTGAYGNGSRGFATRFWSIIGQKAVGDTLSMPDLRTAHYARERFASLLPRQQEAANEMTEAKKTVRPASASAESDYSDGLHIMKMWVRFLESRSRLVEARRSGIWSGSREQVMQRLSSAIEYSKEMQSEIAEIKRFVSVFDYNDSMARESLIAALDEEISFLRNLDPEHIIMTPAGGDGADGASLAIEELMCHPNPVNGEAAFCYNLTSPADKVTITIYTTAGRRIRTIFEASSRAGYNEEDWEAEDDSGRKLAAGTYLYRMVAERDGKKVERIEKLSIIR